MHGPEPPEIASFHRTSSFYLVLPILHHAQDEPCLARLLLAAMLAAALGWTWSLRAAGSAALARAVWVHGGAGAGLIAIAAAAAYLVAARAAHAARWAEHLAAHALFRALAFCTCVPGETASLPALAAVYALHVAWALGRLVLGAG